MFKICSSFLDHDKKIFKVTKFLIFFKKMFIFTFLSVKETFRLSSSIVPVILTSFGFDENGNWTAKIQMNKNSDKPLNLSLQMWDSHDVDTRTSTECNTTIDYGNYLFNLKNPEDIVTLTGTIKDKQIIYPVLANCDRGFNDSFIFEIQLSFQNPDTYLDTRQVLSLTMRPIFIGITSVLIFLWLIYLFIRRSSINKLHITITVLFITYLFFLSFDYEALRRESTQDNPKTFSLVLDIIQAIYTTILFGTLILVAGGWCFIHTEFTIKNVVFSFLAPAVVSFAELWGKHASSSIESIFVLLFELVGLFGSEKRRIRFD